MLRGAGIATGMLRRAGVALAAAALSLGAATAGDTGRDARAGAAAQRWERAPAACELSGSDRARTSSRRCMGCHDGTAGAAVALDGSPRGIGTSHPVERDYAAASARAPNRYVPAEALPPEVPLVAGKVECTSCHDGASEHPKRVAIPRRLCLACHRL